MIAEPMCHVTSSRYDATDAQSINRPPYDFGLTDRLGWTRHTRDCGHEGTAARVEDVWLVCGLSTGGQRRWRRRSGSGLKLSVATQTASRSTALTLAAILAISPPREDKRDELLQRQRRRLTASVASMDRAFVGKHIVCLLRAVSRCKPAGRATDVER